MASRISTGRPARQRGFTYLGLIILVAILGLVGAATLKVGSLLQRAAAEEELLSIGAAFSDALRSYAAATPPGQPQQPPTLQELLKDPRFPGVRRHLRKIFVDPITGKAEWGVMYLGDKVGVLGIYSLSNSKPLKVANFDPRFLNMENREKISEWKFTLSSQTMAVTEALAPPGKPPTLFGAAPAGTVATGAGAGAGEKDASAQAAATPPEPVAQAAVAPEMPAPSPEPPPQPTQMQDPARSEAEKAEQEEQAKAEQAKTEQERAERAEKTEKSEKTEQDEGDGKEGDADARSRDERRRNERR